MPLATKEFVLNYALNRWGLNKKNKVGPTSESIRKCEPKTYEQWEQYYFKHVRSKEDLEKLGKILFEKITTVLPNEKRFYPDLLVSITLEDCLNYVPEVVLQRTYQGYQREFE